MNAKVNAPSFDTIQKGTLGKRLKKLLGNVIGHGLVVRHGNVLENGCKFERVCVFGHGLVIRCGNANAFATGLNTHANSDA